MPSWARYNVSVYGRFLLAGSLGSQRPEVTGSLDVDSVVEQQESVPADRLGKGAGPPKWRPSPQHYFNFRLSP